MNVVIIGTGNVATVLGKRMLLAGHTVMQVYGRRKEAADALARELLAEACSLPGEITPAADLYMIAVSDDALYTLPGSFFFNDKLVVHTAGSVSGEVLQKVSANYGVLYPLQSLRRELDTNAVIPLLIDANNDVNAQTLLAFAGTLSPQVSLADDAQRMKLHVAAVIASNFTNHLYALAAAYCEKEQLDFSLLYPLVEETAQRIRLFPPAQMQTGPAVRGDQATIARHLSLLQSYPVLQQLYDQLTQSIYKNK